MIDQLNHKELEFQKQQEKIDSLTRVIESNQSQVNVGLIQEQNLVFKNKIILMHRQMG
jgi:hypothetical protein